MPLVPRISAGDLPKVLRKSHRSSTNHQSSILKEPHQKLPFETGEDGTTDMKNSRQPFTKEYDEVRLMLNLKNMQS